MNLTKTALITVCFLSSACVFGCPDVSRHLIQPIDQDNLLESNVSCAAACNIMEYIDNPLGWSALNYAIEKKDYVAAAVLIDCTPDINARDCAWSSNPNSLHKVNALERILLQAWHANHQKKLSQNQIDLIHKLLDKGIAFDDILNPPTGLGAPIISFCYFNEQPLVTRLLAAGVNINAYNGRALELAIACGHTSLVRYLILKGADVHMIDMLHSAILSQKRELVQLALDHGHDIHEIDAVGIAMNYTWSEVRNLSRCANTEALNMVRFLLEHGANPNFWLCKKDAKLDLQKAFRHSPLGSAQNLLDDHPSHSQKCYQAKLIRLLVDYGAVDAHCRTPKTK